MHVLVHRVELTCRVILRKYRRAASAVLSSPNNRSPRMGQPVIAHILPNTAACGHIVGFGLVLLGGDLPSAGLGSALLGGGLPSAFTLQPSPVYSGLSARWRLALVRALWWLFTCISSAFSGLQEV